MREITVLRAGLLLETNNAIVLDYKEGGRETSVVLCLLPHNAHHPFVVWTYNEVPGTCERGDYYRELGEAVEGFKERGF